MWQKLNQKLEQLKLQLQGMLKSWPEIFVGESSKLGDVIKPIMQEKLYQTLISSIGKRMTLDVSVPPELGCAQALSALLKQSGFDVPKYGISGTATLAIWMQNNPQFEQIFAPEDKCIIISTTNSGNGSVRGHCGVLGVKGKQFKDDWGIVSNDSQTGLLLELWNYTNWVEFYIKKGQLETFFFRAL